jgi:hypothetical protein
MAGHESHDGLGENGPVFSHRKPFLACQGIRCPEKNILNGVDYYLSYDGPRLHSFRSDIGRVAAGSVRILRSAIFFRYRT